MLTTVKGHYYKGKIVLDEQVSVADETSVLVTFLNNEPGTAVKLRMPGSLKGKVSLPDDFNQPLEDLKEYM